MRPARKSNMRRLSYEWLAGLREIVIDPVRYPLAYEEFRLKEFERDRDGTWVDEIPGGNDHSIDAVRYTVMDDVLRGRRGFSTEGGTSRPRVLIDQLIGLRLNAGVRVRTKALLTC